MTNEERDLITRFVARVGGAGSSGGFSSVPATRALPPIDREADQFIAEQFQSHPEARYRITQTAVVQEAALAEAANRIQRLEWELQQAQKAAQETAQQAQQAPQSRGLFGGGGRQQGGPQQQGGPWNQGGPAYAPQGFQPSSPPPQPQYPPNYQPGMFQQGGGSGFLGSALTTAAGVAGGMVAGNALMGLFSGHSGGGFGGGGYGGGAPVSETNIVNNYGDSGGPPEFDQNTSYDSPQDYSGDSGGGGWDSGGGGFDDNQA